VTESAGKRKGRNATGRGNPYIGGTLGEASISVGRTQTFPGAKYRRLCTRMPPARLRPNFRISYHTPVRQDQDQVNGRDQALYCAN